ncbi:Heavy metal-associated isoprenylated plant protein 6 [Linum perenne]
MGQEIKNDLGGELGQAFIQKQGGACSSSSTEEHDVTTAVNKCVEDARIDFASNKLTVTGKVDLGKVKARVEEKIKKSVEIISP